MSGDCRIEWVSIARNHIFLTVWFQRERREALHSVTIAGFVLRTMMKLVVKNGMEAKI
jgi:hypothetical protein